MSDVLYCARRSPNNDTSSSIACTVRLACSASCWNCWQAGGARGLHTQWQAMATRETAVWKPTLLPASGVVVSSTRVPLHHQSSTLLISSQFHTAPQVFVPRDEKQREQCVAILERVAGAMGHETLTWRTVPTTNGTLGDSAKSTEPITMQWFITASGKLQHLEAEQQVRARRSIEAVFEHDL